MESQEEAMSTWLAVSFVVWVISVEIRLHLAYKSVSGLYGLVRLLNQRMP
jgi:hypothetical protein